MNDKVFLQWIHDRINKVYGESEHVDFLWRLRAIISVTSEKKTTRTMVEPKINRSKA